MDRCFTINATPAFVKDLQKINVKFASRFNGNISCFDIRVEITIYIRADVSLKAVKCRFFPKIFEKV